MTGPDAVRPWRPWSWLAAVAGFGVQTVVTIGVLVSLVVEAVQKHAQSEAKGGIGHDGFLDGLGALVTVVVAVVVGLVALLLLLVLVLSARPGGRRLAGLIVGLVLQVPLFFPTVGALENVVGVAESVMVVGTVLVVVAICVPATWRWARRPAPRELAAPPPWPA